MITDIFSKKGIRVDDETINSWPTRYDTILNSITMWRNSGTSAADFNELDQPGHKFFKVLFHFWNGDSSFMSPKSTESTGRTSFGSFEGQDVGLLAPTWEWGSNSTEEFMSQDMSESNNMITSESTEVKTEEKEIIDEDGKPSIQKVTTTNRTFNQDNILDENSRSLNGLAKDKDFKNHKEFDQMRIIDKDVQGVTNAQESLDQEYLDDALNKTLFNTRGDEDLLHYNSAYNFLIRNAELERAEKLKQFITLLSSISTYSPWYFSEISGLDSVIDRGINPYAPVKIDESPKTITIKCLPDAMDGRIGTLLDLYRDVVYSYTWRKEIVPANLRKFDMSIYIFESPLDAIHNMDGYYGTMSSDLIERQKFENNEEYSTLFPVSYKLIELHDCEINYNTVKTAYSSLKNDEGFVPEYEIQIHVGNAYEHRYNMFMDRCIGDFSVFDMFRNTYIKSAEESTGKIGYIPTDAAQKTHQKLLNAIRDRIDAKERGINGFKLIDNTIEWLTEKKDGDGNKIEGSGKSMQKWLTRVLMGNIYDLSLDELQRDVTNLGKSVRALDIRSAGKEWNKIKNAFVSTDRGSRGAKSIFDMTSPVRLTPSAEVDTNNPSEANIYNEKVEGNTSWGDALGLNLYKE